MKFSVIVPVYNAEKTLRRCVESVIKQPFSDYELILINDGSLDKSGEMCADFASRFSQVKYIDKENGGVSSARNAGLEAASGKYILFLDSDDFVADNYFEALNEMTEKNDCDMYMFSCRLSGGENEEIRLDKNAVYKGENYFNELSRAVKDRRINPPVQKVFLKDITEKIHLRFSNEIYIGEDQLFCLTYALYAESLCTLDKILYNVSLENGDSLSRKRRDDLKEQLIFGHKEMFKALKNAPVEKSEKEKIFAAIAYSFYRSAYSSSKELLKYEISSKERRRRIKDVCRAFCNEKVPTKNFKTFVISLPIRLKTAFLIDKAIRLKK